MSKKLLFSVTAKDCEITAMTAGGPGGQHQNRSNTAIRIIHRASNARGESREYKSQHANKKAAFERMAKSKEFQNWLRIEAAKKMGEKTIEEKVEEQLAGNNLRVEVKKDGKWSIVPIEALEE